MFVQEPAIVRLAASPDDVLTLLSSLNKPMVALEEHPMDEGDATIWSVRRESEMVSTYIHLSLTGRKIGVFYRYEVDPYPEDLRGMVEGEALAFAESLGFIMDNTHYAELDAEERKQHLARGPFEWTGPGEPLELAEDLPGTADFGEAHQEPPAAGAGDRELLSDEEVDGAVRALTGAGPEGLEGEHTDSVDDEFERAIEEFITAGTAGGEAAEQAAPGDPALPEAGEGVRSRSPLSRFRRRESDIYEIRGLDRAPESGRAPEGEEGAPGESREPEAAPAAAPSEDDSPSDAAVQVDPEERRRRARARFLASF